MGNVLPVIAIYMTYLTIAHNIAWWVAYIHREYQMVRLLNFYVFYPNCIFNKVMQVQKFAANSCLI